MSGEESAEAKGARFDSNQDNVKTVTPKECDSVRQITKPSRSWPQFNVYCDRQKKLRSQFGCKDGR
jgi:hypothetical protein